jgi:rhamnulose-1-phosphate aldolase/alcohol dehydrogenase
MDRAPAARPATKLAIPANRWSRKAAQGLSEAELLRYRSNLLGADLAVTNFGGGNTSAKIRETDPLSGAEARILWVKGSGGDLGSIARDGFATLYMEKLLALESRYRGRAQEDDMAGLLPYCSFGLNPRAASIDTPLHAFLPFAHVDHVHPDALIALAASSNGEAITREVFAGEVGWLSWQRPGFDLALRLRDAVKTTPSLRGIVLGGHGLIAWGETSEACYGNTIALIARAATHLNARLAEAPAFGGPMLDPRSPDERAAFAARWLPRLRDLASADQSKIAHFDDRDEVLEFVCAQDAERLAQLGTSCPDHFLRTKMRPLLLDMAALDDRGDAYLAKAFADYRAEHAAYYQRNKNAQSPPMRDPNPVVVLAPGIGLFALAKDKATARIAAEFYANAINVMRGAEAIGRYQGLAEEEAFGIEYWQLEEAKLRRLPKPKCLEGRIALITGGAGGIGSATAARLLDEGACVVLVDRDAERLGEVGRALRSRFSADRVRIAAADVTDERQVQSAFDLAAREYGGLDILVANAGIASSAPIGETTLALWRENYAVLADGYFLAARAAFELMKGHGGSIVFIGSKNAVAATPNASAYASAKAAAVHLARCLALEGAPHGIRANVVNPDAVIKGSHIWDGSWRSERAKSYGVDAGEALEQFYRERSLLKRDVLPGDIAEAVLFFASERSAKSTGNILNVDAGNAQAFTR